MTSTSRILQGNSGFSIVLMSDSSGESIVRKVSASRDTNERAVRQSQKQQSHSQTGVGSPRILNSGFTHNGLFYFDMEFIEGLSGHEYLNSLNPGNVAAFGQELFESIMSYEHVIEDINDLYINKIENIPIGSEKISIIDLAKQSLLNFDWNGIPTNSCHGDLTLENLLISSGRIFYIDFLDIFHESFMQDFTKLLFDLKFFWSARNSKFFDNLNFQIKSLTLYDYLYEKLKHYVLQLNLDERVVDKLIVLHILRVYPYCKTEVEKSILLNALGNFYKDGTHV